MKRRDKIASLLGIVRANPGLATRGYLEICQAEGFWDDEWMDRAVETAQLADLRQLMAGITDELGHRLVHSIQVRDPDTGKQVRYYVHEAAMDSDEFRALANDLVSQINRTCAEVVELARRCSVRHGIDITIPAPIREMGEQYETALANGELADEAVA